MTERVGRPRLGGRRVVLICTLLFCLLGAGPVAALQDWNRVDDPMKGALGLHLGKLGGVGLAYKYPPVWWLNFQVAGGIWNTSDHKRHNVGVELQYLLRQDDRVRLFIAGGLGYFYHKARRDDPPEGEEDFRVSDSLNTGLGVGIEWLWTSRVSLQVELDFTHEGNDGDTKVWPQAGLFYYF